MKSPRESDGPVEESASSNPNPESARLRDSVLKYDAPLEPVAGADWDALR